MVDEGIDMMGGCGMSEYLQRLWNEGYDAGRNDGRIAALKESIGTIVDKLNMSFKQAADLLKMTDEERKVLKETQKA